MRSETIIVACLLAATANCQQKYWEEKEKLPKVLEMYMTESKVERPLADKQTAKAAQEFVDKKLKDNEKSVAWALVSTHILALLGDKKKEHLTILFDAKITECPSEAQKKITKLAGKNPKDSCNVIDKEGNHPCSLRYSKLSGSSSITCSMIKKP